MRVFEYGGEKIRLHELVDLAVRRIDRELACGGAQGGFGDVPEILVALHQRAQPGVFELLSPPELREGFEIARYAGAAAQHYGVDVEQRSICVEEEGPGPRSRFMLTIP